MFCLNCTVCSTFSKRFVGAGHSEEGAGQGGEGTLLRANRARTFRGVWGHSPSEIFEIWILKGAIWCSLGGSEASKLYLICTTLFTVIFNKRTKTPSLLTHYSSFVVMRFATKIRLRTILSFVLI